MALELYPGTRFCLVVAIVTMLENRRENMKMPARTYTNKLQAQMFEAACVKIMSSGIKLVNNANV